MDKRWIQQTGGERCEQKHDSGEGERWKEEKAEIMSGDKLKEVEG